MLKIFLTLLAVGLGGGETGRNDAESASATAVTQETTARTTGSASSSAGSSGASGGTVTEGVEVSKYRAESQVPTGKFTTATEVRPILDMTRANWIAIREYDGNDLLYLSHLMSWRCGLVAIAVSINDGPLEEWEMEKCHDESNSPNAMVDNPLLIFRQYPLGSIETVRVEILYDDLTADTATFDRNGAMMP